MGTTNYFRNSSYQGNHYHSSHPGQPSSNPDRWKRLTGKARNVEGIKAVPRTNRRTLYGISASRTNVLQSSTPPSLANSHPFFNLRLNITSFSRGQVRGGDGGQRFQMTFWLKTNPLSDISTKLCIVLSAILRYSLKKYLLDLFQVPGTTLGKTNTTGTKFCSFSQSSNLLMILPFTQMPRICLDFVPSLLLTLPESLRFAGLDLWILSSVQLLSIPTTAAQHNYLSVPLGTIPTASSPYPLQPNRHTYNGSPRNTDGIRMLSYITPVQGFSSVSGDLTLGISLGSCIFYYVPCTTANLNYLYFPIYVLLFYARQ